MNQQRGKSFRAAKEAKGIKENAERNRIALACVQNDHRDPVHGSTTRSDAVFINKKIKEDSNWRDVEVAFSGHEVPGEGEHKIMEYIQLLRAQPDYSLNI